MFECYDCGTVFSEPDTCREYMGEYWGTPAYDYFPCCPHCKSDDFEEVAENENV